MSRPSLRLRDAALAYASRDIPVLPLHYPLPHHRGIQPVTSDGRLAHPELGTGCSCRDPSCGQVGKHPLGSLVPHGLKEATTNRARVLAWWTQQPQANIGLATGHRFDVLDVDGPAGAQAIRAFAGHHHLESSGPLVQTGGGGWHCYLAPTGLGNVGPATSSRWTGGAGAAMSSPHPAATAPATPTPGPPAGTWTPGWPRCQLPSWSDCSIARPTDPPRAAPSRWPTDQDLAMGRRHSLKNWLGSLPPTKGSATSGCGRPPATSTTSSPPAPSPTTKSTTGCSRPPKAAASSATSPARPTAPLPPAARSAWPTPARTPTAPPTHASP